jgi:hypothetical protein
MLEETGGVTKNGNTANIGQKSHDEDKITNWIWKKTQHRKQEKISNPDSTKIKYNIHCIEVLLIYFWQHDVIPWLYTIECWLDKQVVFILKITAFVVRSLYLDPLQIKWYFLHLKLHTKYLHTHIMQIKIFPKCKIKLNFF